MLTFMKMSLNQFCHYKVKDFMAEKCDEWQIALVHDIYKRGIDAVWREDMFIHKYNSIQKHTGNWIYLFFFL